VAKELVIVVSDVHLTDQSSRVHSHAGRAVASFLAEQRARGGPFTLVLLGDIYDFPRSLLESRSASAPGAPTGSQADSVVRLRSILAASGEFVEGLRAHLEGEGHIIQVAGNHDVDLFWPAVREEMLVEIGASAPEQLEFADGWAIQRAGCHMEHGHQWSVDNAFRNSPPFTSTAADQRLEICWGTRFMDQVYLELEQRCPWVSLVHPTSWAGLRAIREIGWGAIEVELAIRLLAFLALHSREITSGILLGGSPTSEAALRALADVEACPPQVRDGALAFLRNHPRAGLLGGANAGREVDRSMRLLDNSNVRAVIFGHTHRAKLERRGSKYLVNCGTWSGHLRFETLKSLLETPVDELAKRAAEPEHRFTYVALEAGGSPPTLHEYQMP
jgi:UDP-2,3-diacylglucosamine pyrophosphatase LpxH